MSTRVILILGILLVLDLLPATYANVDVGPVENQLQRSRARIKRIMEALHAQQFPPKEECKTRRLLVMQNSNSFEGIGSVMKFFQANMAEAAHSNRTLVWGLDLPYSFHYTREIWQGRSSSDPNIESDATDNKRKVSIGGIDLDCEDGWVHQGGGPYSCFFQQLSSCSLEDADMEELVQLGQSAFSDDYRLRVVEARRGPAVYHPPVHLDPFTAAFHGNDPATEDADSNSYPHEWAAALTAYVFRLKPSLKKQFDRRRRALWPKEAGGKAECQCGGPRSFTVDKKSARVWGVHVRHGDNKAMPDIYGNKRWYPFKDYFQAARDKAEDFVSTGCSVTESGSSGSCAASQGPPTAIFVASDSPDIHKEVEAACSPEELDKWPGGAEYAPCIFAVEPSERYRTEHGSHTAAADGGCWGRSCALHAETVLHYRAHQDQSAGAKAFRILRAVVEGIEDIYLLSRADQLFATGSSHFSVMSLLLSLSRTAVPVGGKSAVFLDQDLINSGEVQNGFLHGSLNRTSLIDPERGYMRWTMHTRRFMEGLAKEAEENTHEAAPIETKNRLHTRNMLPRFPEGVFEAESRRWLGGGQQVWAGECPLPKREAGNGLDVLKPYVVDLINFGAEHRYLHTDQSMLCWLEAERILLTLKVDGHTADINELLDVVQGNMQECRTNMMYPFSSGAQKIQELLNVNIIGKF